MESSNIYLTLVLIGITIIATQRLILYQGVEHFGNPIAVLSKIGKGLVDFFINFIDILLVIADVFSWIAMIPFIIMDILMLLVTWLWPITMIKGVVQSIFTIVKILLLAVIDFAIHIVRMISAKIFGYIKGGLWGIPHTPEQHRSHAEMASGVTDQFGDHHHDGQNGHNFSGMRIDANDHKYRPLRCYKGMGSNGYINIMSTIICPPLGVFMAFGLKGYMKIIACCVLSLMYYIPGLMYALLVTTHLGLGRQITAKDCGGIVNYGIRLAGCTGIKTKIDCESAMIPGWRAKNGDDIRACGFTIDGNDPMGGKCYNIIYPSAVHTTGSNYRYDGETGLGSMPGGENNDKIDVARELATDKKTDDGKIDYNPMNYTKETGDPAPINEIDIPEGPWKFVGGD